MTQHLMTLSLVQMGPRGIGDPLGFHAAPSPGYMRGPFLILPGPDATFPLKVQTRPAELNVLEFWLCALPLVQDPRVSYTIFADLA